MSFCLGLPLPLFPSTISLCGELPLRMCSIQFFCLVLIISIKDLFSSTFFNTSLFVLCSVQLILSILLHIHISKASICLTPPFLIVQVSSTYSAFIETPSPASVSFKIRTSSSLFRDVGSAYTSVNSVVHRGTTCRWHGGQLGGQRPFKTHAPLPCLFGPVFSFSSCLVGGPL